MSVKETAKQQGRHRTPYNWLERATKENGKAAVRNRLLAASSAQPQAGAHHSCVESEAYKLAHHSSCPLSLPVYSVTNELRRLGMNKVSRLQPGPPVVRYEHSRPGEMIHLGIKNLGCIEVLSYRRHHRGPLPPQAWAGCGSIRTCAVCVDGGP